MLFVLNQVTTAGWIEQTRSHLANGGFRVANTELKNRDGYSGAQSQGRAISETKHRSLDEKAEALAQEIIDRLTALTNQPA